MGNPTLARTINVRQMHYKNAAQTVKCVKIYTNATLRYVRATV